MILDTETLGILSRAIEKLAEGFEQLPALAPAHPSAAADLERVLLEVAGRMQDNYPYMHPYYAGQMLKPPHPVARLAYSLALFINPNNHALDGGIASSAMEKEAVAEIAAMFGFPADHHLGHLTSGGTMANLEALWVASRLQPGKLIVASSQAHYTHSRITSVLGIPYAAVDADALGRMDLAHLRLLLQQGNVGTVVVTLGTTSTGSVDPLPEILALREDYNFRVHVDSAYGGYFKLVDNLDDHAARAYAMTSQVDSIVVDPHKHGLQPYGCGCVIFKDPACGALYKHDSPYTYFSSSQLHLGEISLECSRAGASAVALWATQRLLPLVPGGEFARGLSEARQAGMEFYEKLRADGRFIAPLRPELDIVVYAVRAETASRASALAREVFEEAAAQNLHLALATLPAALFRQVAVGADLDWDQENITCLRSCLMKPEHHTYMNEIWEILGCATDNCLGRSGASGSTFLRAL
ncbi:MAG: aspartate aminotransferase family protein [Cyanobacteria bacterium SZAS LIN-3]|nr:aspartate aminotransferase family protein [Cyanobacteria bacterium SZAS LIN-3]